MDNPAGEQCPNHQLRPFQQLDEYLPDKTMDIINYSDVGSSNWQTNSTYHVDSGIGCYIMDSTVDGDLAHAS